MISRLRTTVLGVGFSLALLWCLPGFAQVLKGSISGTVSDSQGAMVAGAQVKATSNATGTSVNTTSDASGLFRFSLIPAGEYKIEVSATGFKTTVQNNVVVAAGADTGVGMMKLSIGESSTSVEVTAEAPLVESSQAQITNTFSGETLKSFAGIQENQGLDNLALFVPGMKSTRDQNFSNTNGGGGFSSNGLRGRNNDQEIDGQNNNDNSVAGPALVLSDSEFVQQYVLISNNFGPEYGRNAGSVVNTITKGGTNAWHGSIYGNENNSILNSLTTTQVATGLTKPPRANDEFTGFTIGGPWVKNKLFFFGGFDNEIVSTGTVFNTGLVTPTPTGLNTLAGCFPSGPSANAVANLSKFGPYGISAGNPTPANLTTVNVANCATPIQVGTVSRLLPTPTHVFNWISRVDWQLDGNNSINGRYIFNRNNSFNNNDNGAAGYVFNVPALSQAVLISWTHNFSGRMVNEARIGFDRLNVEFGGNTIGTEPTANNVANALTQVVFNDQTTLGYGPNSAFPQSRFVNTWQAQDNWNYVLGKHQIKAGVNFTHQQSPSVFLPNFNGQYTYASLSDYVNQNPFSIGISAGNPELGLIQNDTFLYVGDDWKLSRNLTLNYGVTWSFFGQPMNRLNQLDTQNETGSNPLFNPALPLAVRVSPKIDSYKNAVGPSIGFAYSPEWGGFLTGHGRTTVRGGYRLSYDPAFYNIYSNNYDGAPNILAATLLNPGLALPLNPFGAAVRSSLSGAVPVGQLDPRNLTETAVPTNFRPDQVQSWSLGIQRELTKNSAIEARYVGNRASNLFQSVNANPFVTDLAANFPNLVPAGITPCASPGFAGLDGTLAHSPALGRVDCNQGIVLSRNNSASSDYHALQLEFRANNLFKQLTIRSGFTFSKTTDNASEIFSTGGAGSTISLAQNPFSPNAGEHGLSGLDFPRQWTINFSEQLPFFKEQHGFLGHAFGGWAFSADYLVASGQAYTPLMAAFTGLTDGAAIPGGLGTNSFFAAGGINGVGAKGDFFDQSFLVPNLGINTARPFAGNSHAATDSVGIFAGDACFLGNLGVFTASDTNAVCGVSPKQLVSLNGLNVDQLRSNPAANVKNITTNDVRFIANTAIAQQVFGNPFGNVGRNSLRDAISNFANVSVQKNVKFSERVSFEFRATALNVFNHPNFATVVPFLENAGNPNFGNSFANPNLTGDSIPGSNIAASRRLYFGGTIRF